MSNDFQIDGTNDEASFSLKLHRGDGMTLIAMNWKDEQPPEDFVGFAIEYKEPGGTKFFPLKNRLSFRDAEGNLNPITLSSRLSPFQMFRWIHFPRNADLTGEYVYRVIPVFMDEEDRLSYGPEQEAAIELRRETYPGQLNISFTRGFISSQAFVDRYESAGPISTLLPGKSDEGLTFAPTHPKTEEALAWMGFEARRSILELLDEAIADTTAQVGLVLYDLNEPEIVSRIESLVGRVRVIIDDDGAHGADGSAENQAHERLEAVIGAENVKRQHMGKLQHNKTIVVDGDDVKGAICGSTNHSWRGFYVQANNAIVLRGESAVKIFFTAFENYWDNENSVSKFSATDSSDWNDLGLENIDARVAFSPHSSDNARLQEIADDISEGTTSSLFYSLAFLYQTPGAMLNAINEVTNKDDIFVYGMSDHDVKGIMLQKPDGNAVPVSPAALSEDVPEPFKTESDGGRGTRMHHKFVVIDFDKPTARVYMGSYNFSSAADKSNGENLLCLRDRRVAVSYTVEALRLFDHYQFRASRKKAADNNMELVLLKPPRSEDETTWWNDFYTDARKIRDRELFA